MAPAPKDKMHECGECHKTFAHKGNLLRHMAIHDPDNPMYGVSIISLDQISTVLTGGDLKMSAVCQSVLSSRVIS